MIWRGSAYARDWFTADGIREVVSQIVARLIADDVLAGAPQRPE